MAPAAPVGPPVQPESSPGQPSHPVPPVREASASGGAQAGDRPREAPPAPPAASRLQGLELTLGTRWFNVAGIVVLLFAVAFFLKYAYENSWVGPRGRVAIGVLSGIAALIIAEGTRRRGHLVFAQGLTGGGISALYLSFFFSFRTYGLLEATPAFVLMVIVTVCGVALALLQDSLAVALLSFFGAYLTPILLSTGRDAAEVLFAFMTLLGLGSLAVTWFRRWRALDILAFAGTVVLYSGWYGAHYQRERLGVAVAGLGVFFVIFLVIPYGHSLVRRLQGAASDHVLALANGVFAFGYLYAMIHPISDRVLGFIALGLAVAYLGLGILARRRVPADRVMAVTVFGMSIAFLTIAVPLQLGLYGITLAWAVQGVLLVWIGLRYGNRLTRAAGLAVLMLDIGRLLIRHTPLHVDPFTLFWNAAFGTWAFVAAAILAAGWLLRRRQEALGEDERLMPSALPVAAALVLFWALNRDVILYFSLWELPATHRAAAMMLLWVAFPWLLLAAGLRFTDRALRGTGSSLIVFSAIPLVHLIDEVTREPDFLFGNLVFWAGILGVASWAGASIYHGRRDPVWLGEVALSRVLAGAGALLLLSLLTAEVHSHFRLQPGPPELMATNGVRALLGVSVLWALFASAAVAVGFGRSDRACRYGGATLFGVTLLKVFLVDIWELRELYRIISFAVLGLLLVAASFVYSRFRSRIVKAGALLALALLAPGEARAAFDPAEWELQRSIQTRGLNDPFVSVTLDREILEHARADLADLRVVDRGAREVPYVLWVEAGGVSESEAPAEMVNRARRSDGAAVAELRIQDRVRINRLQVETSGSAFRRRVLVEGSDEGGGWVVVEEDGWIYRVPPQGETEGASFDVLELPPVDFPRLRVTVSPMAEEEEPVRIDRLRALVKTETPALTEPLPVERHRREVDPSRKTTSLEIDFGYRHARPAVVAIDFDQEAFLRPFRVYGRNEKRIVTRTGTTETGEPVLSEVEAPWHLLGSGRFHRIPDGREGREGLDETEVRLTRAVARYLRIVIEDQDSPPLTVRDIRARGLVQRIVFRRRPGGEYHLYYGRPGAPPPRYDLEHLIPDPGAEAPASASLGEPRPNPLHGREAEPPFTERHPWLLWVVLISAVGVLALVVLRNMRAASGKARH